MLAQRPRRRQRHDQGRPDRLRRPGHAAPPRTSARPPAPRYNIKLHAMGDVFEDHLKNCRERLAEQRALQGEVRRRRRALLRRLRRLPEGHRLLRPGDAGDAARLPAPAHRGRRSRPARTSSPRSRSPSTAPASARSWPPHEEAKKKGLSVVAGTQRRHQAGYLESMKRIHDGAIGDLVAARVYWNQGGHLGAASASRAGATPSTRSATGTTSPGSAATTSSSSTSTTSTSPCWAHGRPPGPGRRHGRPPGHAPSPSAARATTTSPSTTSSPTASTS